MKVELREHIGRNIATGKPVKLPQYRVFIDGRASGFIGWKAGKLCLTAKFGPIEREEITTQVSAMMKREVSTTKMPDVPPELLAPEEELEDIDDLN